MTSDGSRREPEFNAGAVLAGLRAGRSDAVVRAESKHLRNSKALAGADHIEIW